MRKMMILFLTLALVISLTGTVMAAENGLTLSDGGGQPGQTVYLVVKLNESVVGSSVGLSYSFDSAILEAMPGSSSWSQKGVLQDFDNKHQGVWATNGAKDLKGNLCVLAFGIRPDVNFKSTTVSCTVAIQNGTAEVGTYTAEATVSLVCTHEYGNYVDHGNIGHSRECNLCGGMQTSPHSWDNGIVKENPDSTDTDWKVFTCTVCKGTQTYEIPKSESGRPEETQSSTAPETSPTLPTAPSETQPEKPTQSTRPTTPDQNEGNNSHQNNGTSNGSQNNGNPNGSHETESPWHDYNEPHASTDAAGNVIISEDGHNHTGEEKLPLIIQSHDNGEDEAHDHDYGTIGAIATPQQRTRNFALIAVVTAAMIGSAIWYLKKKR